MTRGSALTCSLPPGGHSHVPLELNTVASESPDSSSACHRAELTVLSSHARVLGSGKLQGGSTHFRRRLLIHRSGLFASVKHSPNIFYGVPRSFYVSYESAFTHL